VKRGWILSLGWLIWAGCMALLLPQRMRAMETGLDDAVRQHLSKSGFTDVDVAMDGQSVELRWRGDLATATDEDALHNNLTRAAEAATAVRPGNWPFTGTSGWSTWAIAPVIIAVADQDSVPNLPPPPPIVATEEDPRSPVAPTPLPSPPPTPAPALASALASAGASASAAAPAPVAVSASASAAASCTDAVTAAISGRRLHFVSASAQLTSDNDAVLDAVYKVVHSCPAGLSLEIDGYTDNIGPAPANLTLSFERARAAAAALVKRGLPQDMVNAHGFGEQNPVAPNTTDTGRAANRRVVFVLRPG
jgi:outer membrane protein OmpA-like peptidoglycan-associated protein